MRRISAEPLFSIRSPRDIVARPTATSGPTTRAERGGERQPPVYRTVPDRHRIPRSHALRFDEIVNSPSVVVQFWARTGDMSRPRGTPSIVRLVASISLRPMGVRTEMR